MLELPFEPIVTMVKVIGSAVAVVTGGATLWKMVIKPSYAFCAKLAKIPAKVDEISAEFKTNGGGSLRDMVQRIENKTSQNAERQRVFLSFASYGVFETDNQGRFVSINRTYLRWTGRTEREVLGEGWVNLIAPRSRDHVMREWERAVQNRRAFEQHFWLVNANTGEEFSVFMNAEPMLTQDGLAFGYIGSVYKEIGPTV